MWQLFHVNYAVRHLVLATHAHSFSCLFIGSLSPSWPLIYSTHSFHILVTQGKLKWNGPNKLVSSRSTCVKRHPQWCAESEAEPSRGRGSDMWLTKRIRDTWTNMRGERHVMLKVKGFAQMKHLIVRSVRNTMACLWKARFCTYRIRHGYTAAVGGEERSIHKKDV